MRKALLVMTLVMLAATARAQEVFSLFVPSEMDDVKRMLTMAGVRDGDVVYDLGSGDGRIVLEAARMNPKVRGRGIEIDGKLVGESNAKAKAQGVHDRVDFVQQDIFDTDLSEATVITMWLFPELMRMLRPKILSEARPGTRVVARMWDLGPWKPDQSDTVGQEVYLWIVPARIGGYWNWDLALEGKGRGYSAVFEQWNQVVEGAVRVGNRRGILNEAKLSGTDISFRLTMTVEGVGVVFHHYTGQVRGDTIEGTVSVLYEPREKPIELPWRAMRAHASGYLARDGKPALQPE